MRHSFFGQGTLNTLYFGGGTPSLLTADEIEKIINHLRQVFTFEDDTEVTLEANPDDLQEPGYLASIKSTGVNRLSIGIQSFHDQALKWMNRAHDRTMIFRALENLNRAGFENYNLDLIYGIPVLNQEQFQQDVETMIKVHPPHISSYCLTIEPRTVFHHQVQKGTLTPFDDDLAADQYLELINSLEGSGYRHYEISNFALREYESRHNRNYWRNVPYLGLGPSAHSYDGQNRWANVRNNAQYLKLIDSGSDPREQIRLTLTDKVNEYILTRLRTDEGIDLNSLMTHFGYDLFSLRRSKISQLQDVKLIRVAGNNITLTNKGKLLADQLARNLFIEEHDTTIHSH